MRIYAPTNKSGRRTQGDAVENRGIGHHGADRAEARRAKKAARAAGKKQALELV